MNAFSQRYIEQVAAYVQTGSEQALLAIEEIGATAIANDMPLDELAGLHESAMLELAAKDVSLNAAMTIKRLSACLATLTISSSLAYRARLDLLEWKRQQERSRSERTRQRLEALGQMVGGVTHELNNILQPITGLTEVMLADTEEDTTRANLEVVAQCAKQATHIVHNILSFVRQDSSRRRPLPFGETIVATTDFLKPILLLRQQLLVDIQDLVSPVMCNDNELKQILINLLQNAAQAGSTRITVAVSNTTHAFTRGRQDTSSRAIRLLVADDGCGMPLDVVQRAVEPFFTTRHRGQGTGLGLAIVHGIIADWGGDLVITSIVNKGTEISAYLPVSLDVF